MRPIKNGGITARAVKIVTGITHLSAKGTDKLQILEWKAGLGTGLIELDMLMLHQGVVPNINLTMAAGLKHQWNESQACFQPMVDESGNSSVPGIMVAGYGVSIGGAESAVERGRLAAIETVSVLHPWALSKVPSRENVKNRLAQTLRGRTFIDLLYRAAKSFRIPQDNSTIVCRCEEITAGEVRSAIEIGATGPNQLKAYCRTGMGPCQGRLCGLTITELIADERGKSPAQIGYYRLRSPIKPISLAQLASIPKDEIAIKAVVRN